MVSKCTDLKIKEVFKNDTLIIDGRNWNPGLLFSQLTSFKFLNELSLREFVFDELSIIELSKAIAALSIEKLSIIECDFNEEMAALFIVPPSVRSIHLEKLNLSSNGLKIILNKLDPSVESITISACYKNEKKKHLLSFSKFSSLKQIGIDKESIGVTNIYHLLRSLLTTSLESITLRQFNLDASKINSILKEFTVRYGKSFTSRMKVFEVGTFSSDLTSNNKLLRRLLSFENLRILSCQFHGELVDFYIDSLPPRLEQFTLRGAIINIKINQEPIYNQSILSAYSLTHLTVNNNFEEFPIYLFHLKNLEYLDIYDLYCDKIPIPTVFQFSSSLKHLIIQSAHLFPFLPNFDKQFKIIETVEIHFRNFNDTLYDLEKLFTNPTLKALRINFHLDDTNNLQFKYNLKYECLLEELELRGVSWKFICHLLDKLSFPRLKKINFSFKRGVYDLYEVLYKLQTLAELTNLSIGGGDVRWEFGKKVLFMFKNLISFNWAYDDIDEIELDHLMLGMPKLQSLYFPTWENNELFLQQPAINIRYLHLPDSVIELNKTTWINLLKNLPNLVQLRNCSKYDSIVEDGITASDLAYYLKVLKEYFKTEFQFKIRYDCLPILYLKGDVRLLKLVRNKSKELKVYLNEILPLSIFGIFTKQLFTIEIEKYFTTINFSLLMKFFKFIYELEIENEQDIVFVKSVLLDGKSGRLTEETDFSLPNFYNLLLKYLIGCTKVNLEVEHLEFLIHFFKTNKQHGFEKIIEFFKTFFISLSTTDGNLQLIDKEMFCFFSSHLLAPSFCFFFDKIKNKELGEREKKFIPIDFNSIADDLKRLEPDQYQELSVRFKDFLIEFTNVSFIESFSNILKKILIPEAKCAICYESLFSEECKFFKVGTINCHLYHKSCLNKWLDSKKKCPHCCQVIA